MKRQLFLIPILCVLLTACQPDSSAEPGLITPDAPVIVLTETPIPVVPTGLSLADLRGECENLLWPLRQGMSWEYLSSRGETVSLAVGEEEGGITLVTPLAMTRMNCLETALAGLPPAPFTAHPDLGVGLIGSGSVGFFLPDAGTLSPYGSMQNWTAEVTPAGQIFLAALGYDQPLAIMGGRIALISSTGALETVSTPAGSYRALPVSQQTFLDLRVIAPDGSEMQVLITLTGRLYFSEGVGLVRMEYTGGTISTPGLTGAITEAVSYDLQSITFP